MNTNVQGSETIEQEKVGQAPAEQRPDGGAEEPRIVDDICVEELAIDGICGVY